MTSTLKRLLVFYAYAGLLFAGYAVFFLLFHHAFGNSVAIFAFIPPLVIAWIWGIKRGILAGIAVDFCTIVLVNIGGGKNTDLESIKQGIPSIVAVIIIAAIVGYMRELRERAKRELEEKKKTESALRESELRFKSIFEGSNDALMLLDEKGFFDCNSATVEMFGFASKEEFTKVHPADISPPNQPDGTESFPAAREQIKTAFEQGSNRFEWVHRRTGGEDFPVEVLLSAFNLNGRQVLQATVRDISRRKQAEDTLRKNEAMLKGIYSAAPVGISVSHERIMTTVNGGLCEITGYSPEELTGKTALMCFIDDEEFERVGRELYGSNNREVRKNIEARWRRKDGTLIDVLINKAPMDANDPKVGNVISVLDITKQKQAQQALVESEKSFKGMFEMTSEGVGLITPRTSRFIGANPALCSMFGYSEKEFCTLTPDDLTPPESKEIMQQSVATFFRLGYVPDHEETSMKKDGTRVHSIIGSRQLQWKGETVGFITYKNITSLKEAQDKLKNKNAEILEFINMVTHDLKKPLTVMKTINGLAKMNAIASGDTEFLEATQIGAESMLYMQEMLDDLLTSAKIEAGTTELALEEFPFKEAVGQVVQRLKYHIEEKRIRISTGEKDLRVKADPKQFGRLLMNLVGNAINYSGDKPDKHISIECELKEGQIVFTVKDNGIGIPLESQAHLFTKFKRGANVSGISGTGLGLSIVKGIVLAHGGEIWFESKEGEGTAFHFTLG